MKNNMTSTKTQIIRTLFFIMIASVMGGVLYAVIHDLRGFDLIWMMVVTAFNCYIAAGFFDDAFPKEREKE